MTQTTWGQKVEAESHPAGCTGLRLWWEAKCQDGKHLLRPFTHEHLLPAPATQPLLIVNFAQIWILTTSCQSGGSLHGNQKKVPSDPQGRSARCQPTVQHSLVPTAPKTLSLSCLTQGWILVHFHGAGVSELVWMGERCPAKVTRIQGVLSWQHSPWGSQDKVHHWKPRWALLREHSCAQLPGRPTQSFVQILRLGHRQL